MFDAPQTLPYDGTGSVRHRFVCFVSLLFALYPVNPIVCRFDDHSMRLHQSGNYARKTESICEDFPANNYELSMVKFTKLHRRSKYREEFIPLASTFVIPNSFRFLFERGRKDEGIQGRNLDFSNGFLVFEKFEQREEFISSVSFFGFRIFSSCLK